MSIDDLEYQKFLKNLQPIALGVDSCSAKVERESFGHIRDADKEGGILNRVSAAYRLVRFREDHFDVAGSVSISIGDEEVTVLSISCEIRAHFHGDSEITKEFAERFASAEARLFFWPYFREFVSSLATRMGVPPLMLPLTLSQRAPATETSADKMPSRSTAGRGKRKKGRR